MRTFAQNLVPPRERTSRSGAGCEATSGSGTHIPLAELHELIALQCFDGGSKFIDGRFGIAEKHRAIGHFVERIFDAGETGTHRAFEYDNVLRFVDIED